jgi:DNA-binding NtrC family response regulator
MATDQICGAPFAALVDVRMPGAPDGEALRRMAAAFPQLPMIVITAFAERAPAVAHRGVFEKPFDTAQLLSALEQIYRERTGG